MKVGRKEGRKEGSPNLRLFFFRKRKLNFRFFSLGFIRVGLPIFRKDMGSHTKQRKKKNREDFLSLKLGERGVRLRSKRFRLGTNLRTALAVTKEKESQHDGNSNNAAYNNDDDDDNCSFAVIL